MFSVSSCKNRHGTREVADDKPTATLIASALSVLGMLLCQTQNDQSRHKRNDWRDGWVGAIVMWAAAQPANVAAWAFSHGDVGQAGGRHGNEN